MSTAEATRTRDDTDAVVAAAKAGHESAFTALVERHRGELQLHCYRMLGSYEESEDMVQETFLRAWRKRSSFEGRSSFRTWLYRIATNACLDAIARSKRRVPEPRVEAVDPGLDAGSVSEVPWLQPYPDRLLEGIAPSAEELESAIVAKETIELAFLVAIQHLPPRQRAVLIVRDVLSWSAKETASLLETTVASVNSALQRARATLKKHLPARRLEWSPGADASAEERALLERYVEAHERADPEAFIELLREDASFTMPPEPGVWLGRRTMVDAWKEGGMGTPESRDFRCLVTRANRQPAVACYRRKPGESEYRPMALDVLRIEDGAVAEIIAFPASVFASFELPPAL